MNGCNDHPDAKSFAQGVKIFSTRALLRPPRGSNVCGDEILIQLQDANEELVQEEEIKNVWLEKIHEIFSDKINCIQEENNDILLNLDDEMEDVDNVLLSIFMDHDYDISMASPEVIAYLSGFIIFNKLQTFLKCDACSNSLCTKDFDENIHTFIKLLDKGHLIYPSLLLVKLIGKLEEITLSVVQTNGTGLQTDTVHKIINNILNRKKEITDVAVGCSIHKWALTEKILLFFINLRADFLCKSFNLINMEKKKKSKELKKQSRY